MKINGQREWANQKSPSEGDRPFLFLIFFKKRDLFPA